jgi:hypothetical protein
MDAAEHVREAINLGLAEFTSYLPHSRRVREAGHVIEEPKTITCSVTDGSPALTIATGYPIGAYASAASLPGAGIVLAADPRLNRLLSATEMLGPYLGASGSTSGIIYGDAITFGARAGQIAGTPYFTPAGASQRHPLTHIADGAVPTSGNAAAHSGYPSSWWVDSFGGGDSQTALWLLRLHPLPSSRGILTVPMAQVPAAVTLTDLYLTARSIPTLELEEGLLVAICAENLLSCVLWRETTDKNIIRASAAKARQALETQAQHNPAAQSRRCGTPPGF